MHIETKLLKSLSDGAFTETAEIEADRWKHVLFKEYGTKDLGLLFGAQYDRLQKRCEVFPEGQIVAYCHDIEKPIGVMGSLRLHAVDTNHLPRTWSAATGDGYFTTHRKHGDMLVCPSICTISVDKLKGCGLPEKWIDEYKKEDVAGMLIDAQLKLALKLGVKDGAAYSRPMNYAEYIWNNGKVSIGEYLKAVKENNKIDKAIGLHVSKGAYVALIIPNGRPLDPEAKGYNIIMDYSDVLEDLKKKMQKQTQNAAAIMPVTRT